MNIKKDSFYNKGYSLEELQKIEERLEKMVERSQGAIERTKDWRYQTTKQHQLYKEFLKKKKEGIYTVDNLQNTLQSINALQAMLAGKGATLKGTKEIIKNREQALINKEMPKLMNDGYTEAEARKMLTKTVKDRNFYDFLHSDTYAKLSKSVGKAGSPTILAEFVKFEKSAIKYYENLVKSGETQAKEITFKDLLVE